MCQVVKCLLLAAGLVGVASANYAASGHSVLGALKEGIIQAAEQLNPSLKKEGRRLMHAKPKCPMPAEAEDRDSSCADRTPAIMDGIMGGDSVQNIMDCFMDGSCSPSLMTSLMALAQPEDKCLTLGKELQELCDFLLDGEGKDAFDCMRSSCAKLEGMTSIIDQFCSADMKTCAGKFDTCNDKFVKLDDCFDNECDPILLEEGTLPAGCCDMWPDYKTCLGDCPETFSEMTKKAAENFPAVLPMATGMDTVMKECKIAEPPADASASDFAAPSSRLSPMLVPLLGIAALVLGKLL